MEIRVQAEDFDVQALYQELLVENKTGAVVIFVGLVREFSDNPKASFFELEHYPGMTEHNIRQITDAALARWPLLKGTVVHRVGKLSVNDQIVFVGVSAEHRAEAFNACDFIMDYLKSRAAFWKKEQTPHSSAWVNAKESDEKQLNRW